MGALTATTGSFSGQLTSTVATGTAPLVVTSPTVVANLNADLLDDMHAINLVPFGTISDFANGTLVITDLDAVASSGPSWTIEVVGKGYGQTPIKFIAEGYNYNDTFINTAGYNYGATTITYIRVLNYNNYLAFWWPRLGYWNSFAVTVMDTTSEAIRKNRVTSVINAADPAVTKEVQINLVSFAVSTSSITIGSTAISLGSSATTIAGLTSVTSTTFVGALTGTASGNLTSASTLDASKLSGTIPAAVIQTEWDDAYTHSQVTTGSVHGATTVGNNLFRLTNPSAITFLRVNADNSVSALDAATFRTAIGAGTVTSVGGTGTVSGLTLSGTVTSSGNLTLGGSISGLTTSNLSASAGITNGQLANSSITIGSSAVSLGGTLETIAGLTSLTSTTIVATTSLTTGSAGQTWVIDGSGTSLLFQSGATPTTRMTLTDSGVVTATTFVGALTGTASGNLIKSTYPGA